MSASDEIEAAMLQQITARKAQEARDQAKQEQLAKRLDEEAARLAAGFIELMDKHHIEPEPIYCHTQVSGYGRRYDTYESFKLVDRGWVFTYVILGESTSPSHIMYLRRDGKAADCQAKGIYGGFEKRGLVPPPARTVFGAWTVLCTTIIDGATPKPKNWYFKQEDFIKAAEWYLYPK